MQTRWGAITLYWKLDHPFQQRQLSPEVKSKLVEVRGEQRSPSLRGIPGHLVGEILVSELENPDVVGMHWHEYDIAVNPSTLKVYIIDV
jgi:hypothetical protein